MSAELGYSHATYVAASEVLRLAMLAEKSNLPVSCHQAFIRGLEHGGALTVLSMDDDTATVCWHDERLARVLGARFARRVAS